MRSRGGGHVAGDGVECRWVAKPLLPNRRQGEVNPVRRRKTIAARRYDLLAGSAGAGVVLSPADPPSLELRTPDHSSQTTIELVGCLVSYFTLIVRPIRREASAATAGIAEIS